MGPGLARVTHLDASFLGGDRDAFQSARGTGPTSCFPGEVREGHLKIMCALAEAWSQAEHQRTPNFQWWLIAREETFSRTVLCLLKRILVPSPESSHSNVSPWPGLVTSRRPTHASFYRWPSHFSWKAISGSLFHVPTETHPGPSPRKLASKCVTLARPGPKPATNARHIFNSGSL